MPTASEARPVEARPEESGARRLYRSRRERVIAGVSGGLGEYFGIDPVWIRIGFVLLTIGGGAGVLIYLIMWLLVPEAPEGYLPPEGARRGAINGAAVIGLVFMVVGSIALVNTIAPSLGQYFWPLAFLIGGLALVLGGLNRDNDR